MFIYFATCLLKHAYRLPGIHDRIFVLTSFIFTEFGIILNIFLGKMICILKAHSSHEGAYYDSF